MIVHYFDSVLINFWKKYGSLVITMDTGNNKVQIKCYITVSEYINLDL